MRHYEKWMQEALLLAQTAKKCNEVPVGAVVVLNQEIIGGGYNCPISSSDPTAHAEIIALRAAAKAMGNYRLINATLVVTLEPCLMCFSAMIHARIKKLVFGAWDAKAGVESAFGLFTSKKVNHTIELSNGIFQAECTAILRNFFREKR